MNRHLRITCAIFIVLISLPSLSFRDSVARQEAAAASPSQTLRLSGLRASVTLRRDERGIPYIEAANDQDLYFAQGYATASDRLWQMDLLRRTARGELSEIFGRATLEEDKRRRAYGFAAMAETLIARLSPQGRAMTEAYARGVNAFIDSLDAKSLPSEFRVLRYRPRPWTPADSLVVGKNFAEVLSTTWHTDVMRAMFTDLAPDKRQKLFPTTSPLDVPVVGSDKEQKRSFFPVHRKSDSGSADASVTQHQLTEIVVTMKRSHERIGLYAEDLAASNNWVVSGTHTASGKPLLANDPHLSPSAPSIWYMAHLSAPGVRVAGVTAPGAPGIIIGHNERIAWGMTNLGPDVQDVYREKFDPANSRRYMTPAGWREAEVRHEEIKVRKNFDDVMTESIPLEVTVTRHGPIILERDGVRYALRWTALDATSDEFQAFHQLNRAGNWKEFREALRNYAGPTQNFVYADTDGHIGYYGAGRIPIRQSGDGSLPYDGSTNAGEWTRYIPFEQLPHVFDPPSGVIVTANSRVVGLNYPHHLTHQWAAPYRTRRIHDLLNDKRKITIDDFRAIQGDTYSISGALFAREVVKVALAASPVENDAKWQEALRLLDGWDGRMDAESSAAALVSEMRDAFSRRILISAVGGERAAAYRWSNRGTFIDRVLTERPRDWLPKEFKDYAELLRACYADAREALIKKIGADESQWTWGRSVQVRFPHLLGRVPLVGQRFTIPPFSQNGSGGSTATVNVGDGVSMRFIADPGNWDNTQQGITLGQSGDPASPHWSDQLADWRAVTPRVFPFTSRAVNAAAKETIVLSPVVR